MNKFFKSYLGWASIALLGIFIAAFILWSRLPDMIASHLSKTLGVHVSIHEIDILPTTIDIENFSIDNIPSGVLPTAFSVEQIFFSAPLKNYLGNPIQIERIELNNVYLGLEFDSATSTKGNWTRILSNAQSHSAPTKQKEKTGSGKVVTIKEVVINNISTELVYLQGDGKIKRLPVIGQIVLRNINTEEGFPMDQLMNSVLGQMLTEVFIKQNLKNMIENLVPKSSELNQWLEPFKGFLK